MTDSQSPISGDLPCSILTQTIYRHSTNAISTGPIGLTMPEWTYLSDPEPGKLPKMTTNIVEPRIAL